LYLYRGKIIAIERALLTFVMSFLSKIMLGYWHGMIREGGGYSDGPCSQGPPIDHHHKRHRHGCRWMLQLEEFDSLFRY